MREWLKSKSRPMVLLSRKCYVRLPCGCEKSQAGALVCVSMAPRGWQRRSSSSYAQPPPPATVRRETGRDEASSQSGGGDIVVWCGCV